MKCCSLLPLLMNPVEVVTLSTQTHTDHAIRMGNPLKLEVTFNLIVTLSFGYNVLEFKGKTINTLLSKYAQTALYFSIVQAVEINSYQLQLSCLSDGKCLILTHSFFLSLNSSHTSTYQRSFWCNYWIIYTEINNVTYRKEFFRIRKAYDFLQK